MVLNIVINLDYIGKDVSREVVLNKLVKEDRFDLFRLDFLHYLVVADQLIDEHTVIIELGILFSCVYN